MVENNPRENVIHMFLNNDENKGENQVMENQKATTTCDKCGEEKETMNGRCDDCFEKHGDPLEETEGATLATQKERPSAEPVMLSDGQFSLFGFDAVVEESKKGSTSKPEAPSCGEEKAPKKASGAKSTAKASFQPKAAPKSPVKKQDIAVEGDWSIHYATNTFRVSDFFEEMPESGKVTLEELRAAMEQEFFEITKQRVKWDYDEEQKRLFPDVTGTSKGGF